MSNSCICVGGVNYSPNCSCKNNTVCLCGGGGNPLSMNTTSPNPSVGAVGGCRNAIAASSASCILNSIGKWGSVITAQATGTPLTLSASGAKVGVPAVTGGLSGTTLILILIVAAALVFLAFRK